MIKTTDDLSELDKLEILLAPIIKGAVIRIDDEKIFARVLLYIAKQVTKP